MNTFAQPRSLPRKTKDQLASKAKSPRKGRRAARIAGAAAVIAATFATGATLVASGKLDATNVVTGSPTANPNGVAEAAAERKAAEAEAAAERKAADAAAFLAALETAVKRNMQEYFDDPANDKTEFHIRIRNVALVKAAENKYEGMATMTAYGGPPRDIPVHVTADDRTMMWSTDPGALLALFR